LSLATYVAASPVSAREGEPGQTPEQRNMERASYSAELCIYQQAKKTAESNVAREKALGKKYGVLNTDQIVAETSRIGVMNSLIPQTRAALKKVGGPLPCGNDEVASLVTCFWKEFIGGYCDQEAMERCEFASVPAPVTTCLW